MKRDDGVDGTGRDGMPRWVRAMVIIAVAVVAVLLVLQFVIGGEHTPARHLHGSGDGSVGLA